MDKVVSQMLNVLAVASQEEIRTLGYTAGGVVAKYVRSTGTQIDDTLVGEAGVPAINAFMDGLTNGLSGVRAVGRTA